MGVYDSGSDEANAYDQARTFHPLLSSTSSCSFPSQFSGSHKTEVSHQLLAGAASFFAAREYEKYCEKQGKPQTHADAKALIAGFAGAFVDREVETRGLDFIDKEKAKYDAHHAASEKVKEMHYSDE
ncbi:hypothetical protein MKEN_00358300 [Mycena kentingensis (nom. inval.)]|nr:hypothetical protein MKEN_00358300 [Mycena kentingensis (nom. inval.)]